jgi:hypothetical protein
MAFNDVGSFTISPGNSIRIDGWMFPGGADRGAQYFSAHPTFRHTRLPADGMFIMSDQSKFWVGTWPDGHMEYGFRVTYVPETSIFLASFSVQGGGFV